MNNEPFLTRYFYSQLGAATEDLCLSICIAPGSFTYAVSTDNFTVVKEICQVEFTSLSNSAFDLAGAVSHLVNNYRLNQKKFLKTYICLLNQEFTLVPTAFVEEDQEGALLSLAVGVHTMKKPSHHQLNNVRFSYVVDQDLLSYLERTFPNASIRHSGAVAISLISSHHALTGRDLYMHLGGGLLELGAIKDQQLLFYNVFQYSVAEDVLYYLLFMMEQFSLNPLKVRLVISGEEDTTGNLIKSIKRYIKQVDFAVHHRSIKLGGEFQLLPQHYYFTLLNQHLCEL